MWVAIVSAAGVVLLLLPGALTSLIITAVAMGLGIRCRGKHTNPERDYMWNRIDNEAVQCVITLEWLKHGHKYVHHLYTRFTDN